ncbi:MAG: TIGR01458 family HAD-type hydrolase [Chloroflexota bacterium]|nr:TIGR01458 family HAD-type hydrolase [Chloroflexota bacterium]
MSDHLASIDGLLLDIEGVLLHGSTVIPGALETLAALRAQGLPYQFITNTTIYCRYTLLERLQALGFAVEINQLYTATYAAAQYLRDQNARSYYPLLLPDAQMEFAGIDVDEDTPEFVVVGDMGPGFTFPRLNKALRALLNGAKLVALHKKRRWRTEEGLFLDAGPFVVALEYAAGVNAEVIGMPSQTYFHRVVDDWGLVLSRIAMIGEDVETAVLGAQRMGMQGWLVKTGRFRKEDLGRGIWPDKVLESIADIL